MVVALKSHGGACCGARHIHGFDSATEAALDTINAALTAAPTRRAVEVILNGNQVGRYPGILARLAQLGFVYDGHWKNGNHDSDNYRFTRCDDRKPLTLAGWNGMIMDPALTGRLPELPGQTQHGGGVPDPMAAEALAHYIRPTPAGARDNAITRSNTINRAPRGGTGSRYRIDSPRSRYHNQEYICLGAGGGGYDRLPTWRFRAPNGTAFEIAQTNCVLVAAEGLEAWNRPFVVGDRVQVARGWSTRQYPVGLCGTVMSVRYDQVQIQFDPPGYGPMHSALEYIHLVLEGTQPDVPRTRIQPPAAAPAPVLGDQRHTVDANYVRPYPIPAGAPEPVAGARAPGSLRIGDRVRRLNEPVDGIPVGMEGEVLRAGGNPRVRWDNGRATDNYPRNLQILEVPVAPAAPPPPAPEVREVRVEVPVEPARTIIASTYHCVFRNGNRGAGYDTLAEAQAALGRRTRIDRREFFNTAPHMRWVENVPH